MSTVSAKPETVARKWVMIDAEGAVLGRLASKTASILRGKEKPIFTPHVDTGDCVVIINADKIKVTGNKTKQKIYYRHTEYPGGLKETTFEKMMEKDPVKVIEKAVKGMLPKNPLGRAMFRKLKVCVGTEHSYQAQQPELIKISED